MKRSRVLLPNTIRLSPWLYTSFMFLSLLHQLVSGQQEQLQDSSLCCHVVAFAVEEFADDGTWAFAATMSSPYEIGWDKYCDSFEVRTLPASEGDNYTVLAKRVFGHPHPTEQPFTRRVFNVVLPDGVDTVVAVAHDLIDGFCGNELTLTLAASEPTSVTAPPTTPSPILAPLPTLVPTGAPVATNTEAPVIPSAPITAAPETGTPVITGAPEQDSSLCCHVVAFAAEELADDGMWAFAATMSSPYEIGWDKYCDSFEVRTLPASEGDNYTVLAKRVFGHPHPTEQPFTRRVFNVVLPDGVDTVVAVAHDLIDGFCGNELTLTLDGSEPTSVTAPPTTPSPVLAPLPTAPSVKPSDDSGAYRSVSITAALVVAAFFLV